VWKATRGWKEEGTGRKTVGERRGKGEETRRRKKLGSLEFEPSSGEGLGTGPSEDAQQVNGQSGVAWGYCKRLPILLDSNFGFSFRRVCWESFW